MQEIQSFKAAAKAQLESLDERLSRIEKIIDRLQLSVLQKVGDYVNDVQNLKKELVETQKSFTSISNKQQRQQPQRKPTTEDREVYSNP